MIFLLQKDLLVVRLIKIRPAIQIGRLDTQLRQDGHDLRAVLDGMIIIPNIDYDVVSTSTRWLI